MNPERQEAYLNLIERVLTCPNGQEPEVLSSCSDLIDAGFVQMLIQISASMAGEGDRDTANFLVQLARLLGKSLGLSPDLVPTGYSSAQG
ncbi:hypothetical protein IQ269_25750 [Tychonema sp. LEGE 07199]|uniref:hypothetical protein n=1 Tax=unclassified Tychonema TaxID=2642144 RepID=UPI0018805A35|nr:MULTISPECIES: hypothetical protein [unclassified Tychonema]MBE9124111.1 hypothetical protein [Tychonema sp. LEGE 07199]MBE9132911.1 hypothetical protein [Tychonema sp. LEGE 07196]